MPLHVGFAMRMFVGIDANIQSDASKSWTVMIFAMFYPWFSPAQSPFGM
ncbi:MAG: hypothetical protein Q7K57_46610 [Burkholderiaceae bacterium]|nr:hypothetical protein [Burkholderiaceae bacterium]